VISVTQEGGELALAVQRQRQRQRQDDEDGRADANEAQGVPDDLVEDLVVEQLPVVGQPHPEAVIR